MAIDFPASSASPFTAPNGVVYTWNSDGYWEAKSDNNYLKLDATNGPVTGALTFEGLTTHEDGIHLTGGGMFIDSFPPQDENGNSTSARINDKLEVNIGNDYRGFRVDLDCNNKTIGRHVNHFISGGFHNGGNIQGEVCGFRTTGSGGALGVPARAFIAGYSASNDVYNFYAGGDAPNYLNGGLLISSLTDNPGDVNNGSTNGKYCDGSIFYSSRSGTGSQTHFIFRNPNGSVGQFKTEGSNLVITGLAGGPLLRNGLDLDSTEGLVEVLKQAYDTIQDLKGRIEQLEADHVTMMNNNNGGGY